MKFHSSPAKESAQKLLACHDGLIGLPMDTDNPLTIPAVMSASHPITRILWAGIVEAEAVATEDRRIPGTALWSSPSAGSPSLH